MTRKQEVEKLARAIVKSKILMWVSIDGETVGILPNLKEARRIADDIQALLDLANGKKNKWLRRG